MKPRWTKRMQRSLNRMLKDLKNTRNQMEKKMPLSELARSKNV